MTTHTTLVDVFETVLQVPFDQKHFRPLDRAKARELALGVRRFYESFAIPDKEEGELRPYLSPRFSTARGLGVDYYAGEEMFKNGNYSFDASKVKEIAPQLKTYLLYCHSLCIYDALPALLDHFRFGDGSSGAESRLPALNFLLQQYASVAPLLRHHILIPVADEVKGLRDKRSTPVDDDEVRAIAAELKRQKTDLGKISPKRAAELLGPLIKQQLWLRDHCGGKFDLYFPRRAYVPALLALLRSAEAKFSSATVLEPFNVGILGSVSRIDPERLSMQDIVDIRREDAFDEFRAFLRRVFERLNRSEQYFSDFDAEFVQAVRDEMEANKDKIKSLTEKSNVLRDAFSQIDRIIVGAVTGSIGGIAAGSPEIAIIGAALGGGFRPLYDIVRGAATRPSRLSIRNHFLALDPSRDRSTE